MKNPFELTEKLLDLMDKLLDFIGEHIDAIYGLCIGVAVGALLATWCHTEALNRENFRQYQLKYPASRITYEEYHIVKGL